MITKKNPVVLSLFDGMSCGRLTLDKMGIVPDKYYSSEIDKFAIKEVAVNFPDNIPLGDVSKWKEWDIDWSSLDLLIGGVPCTGWSFAGKQAGTKAKINGEDFIISSREQYIEAKRDGAEFYSQTHLFWEYVLCLDYAKKMNPNIHFLLENVKMKKFYLDMITEALGVEPIFINSALVSATNRQRHYWCSWNTQDNPIPLPEDRGILFTSILEDGEVEKDKSYCIDANYFKGGSLKNLLDKRTRERLGEKVSYSQSEQRLMVRCGAMRGRYVVDGVRQDSKMKTAGLTTQRIEVRYDNKSNALTTVQKDNNVVYEVDGETTNYAVDDVVYRKLSVIECCRLHGVPDDFFKVSSNTQAYKMIGNGWQIDTIEYLFSYLFKEV